LPHDAKKKPNKARKHPAVKISAETNAVQEELAELPLLPDEIPKIERTFADESVHKACTKCGRCWTCLECNCDEVNP